MPTSPRSRQRRPAESSRDNFDDDTTIDEVEFSDADLTRPETHALGIDGCRFDNCRLGGVMRGVTIYESELSVCDLANLQADECTMAECAISTSRLTGMSWTAGSWRDVLLESTRADLTNFRYSKLRTVVFRDCDLRQADFEGVEFRNVAFEHCNLTGARFTGTATRHNLRFTDCTLADIDGVAGLRGATVDGGDLLGLAASLAREAGITVRW
ncbi:pentapeptide repeat-containing protein [Nocardia cyriacigeorgica]|uniref:Pentapeptide repeat-containing protein n=1 Tax=Nocardia cyriacigeorgica TaxID=135487 RepID=A0A6P1D7J0_9NOCA|nr:pentapeptide repeat-containing protein [Nocardia cyriacigeorgica]NEW42345.1 pentapeptide repeat-containing protein [Nocardia cyriacigeorgica]NEW46048.1 pentapeptide repeat-containing protein [Nocardia cyriacigeorgica]NEW53241.1 pentapeptide repeat-containing protein [Nocardia cyriacigeorgica]